MAVNVRIRSKRKQETPKKEASTVWVPRSKSVNGLPLLKLPFNSQVVFDKWMGDDANKLVIYRHIVRLMKLAIKNNWDVVEAFRLGVTPQVARINKVDFEKTLSELKTFFVDTEEFELADTCVRLIDKHKVNKLLDDTRQVIDYGSSKTS